MSGKRKGGDDVEEPDAKRKGGKSKGKGTVAEKIVTASHAYRFDWKLMPRRPFRRGFAAYWPGELGSAEAARRRKLFGIQSVEDPAGEEVTPAPVDSFEEAGVLPPWLLEAMREHDRYDELTPMQSQAVPIALTGTNFVGIAPSVANGNEATAYLAPAVMHAEDQHALTAKEPGPIVLIIVPTEKIATKVVEEANKLLVHASRSYRHFNGMRAVNVSGGGVRSEKLKELSRIGAHIVVGTPKRLHDMAAKEQISLIRVTLLIIDGAEKMVELGFLGELRDVANWVRPERHTMLFATSWPRILKDLALELTFPSGSPVRITCLGERPAVVEGGKATAEDLGDEVEVELEDDITTAPRSALSFGCPPTAIPPDFPEDW